MPGTCDGVSIHVPGIITGTKNENLKTNNEKCRIPVGLSLAGTRHC